MSHRLLVLLLCLALTLAPCLPALAEDAAEETRRFVAPDLPEGAIPYDANHPELLDADMIYARSAILIQADTG